MSQGIGGLEEHILHTQENSPANERDSDTAILKFDFDGRDLQRDVRDIQFTQMFALPAAVFQAAFSHTTTELRESRF